MIRRPAAARLQALFGLLALLLAACELAVPKKPPTPEVSFVAVTFDALPGWRDGQPELALPAWRRSCERILAQDPATPLGGKMAAGTAGDWAPLCRVLAALPTDAGAVRGFVERNFQPYAVHGGGEGLFTGYFEPIVHAAPRRDATHHVPIRALPADHVSVDLGEFDPALAGRSLVGRVESGRLHPYPDRAAIATRTDGDGVLYWADDDLDVFILQVQGSGLVELPDGTRRRIGFAGHNGRDYVSIGRWLIDHGELKTAAWPDIRAWMARNPARVRELLERNRRYIFFRELASDGAQGAAGVVLTPGYSLAVDPAYLPLNVPLWLDTTHPGPDGGPLQRLVLAQDVGNAIRGPVRGDLFWGVGPQALALAGRMKQPGAYYLLLPLGVAPSS